VTYSTDPIQRDQRAYALAKEYLLSLDGVTPDMVDRHLHRSTGERPDSLPGIYRHLLETAQNRTMSPSVIGNAIGGVDKLGDLLCEFEPAAVAAKYGYGWETVLGDIVTQLKPRGKIRKSPKSLWPQFCRTITSGARFLVQFRGASDFYAWADSFDLDDRTRPALPMLLSYEIEGFGFPLACDFLKELGYPGFGKPDVHLKKIFVALGLSPSEHDYQVFKAIVRVARNVRTTPYDVDKLFWLIGSGNFYLDGVKIGRHRDDFIRHATRRMNSDSSLDCTQEQT
jgi:hypothetical protein